MERGRELHEYAVFVSVEFCGVLLPFALEFWLDAYDAEHATALARKCGEAHGFKVLDVGRVTKLSKEEA